MKIDIVRVDFERVDLERLNQEKWGSVWCCGARSSLMPAKLLSFIVANTNLWLPAFCDCLEQKRKKG